MDREALATRNRAMTAAFHRSSLKQYLRRSILQGAAALPIPAKIAAVERFLLIRPDHLGDVILATPAITALRAARPNAEIHVLVNGASAPALASHEGIDAVLTLPFPGFTRTAKGNIFAPYALAWKSAQHLASIGYSHAFVLRPDHGWGALMAKWAGIPVRIGYDQQDTAPFLTDAIPLVHEHAVLQNARLIAHLTGAIQRDTLALNFRVEDDDRAWVSGYLAEWEIAKDARMVMIHPGSGTSVKRWEPEKWAHVGDILAEEWEAQIVITGGDHELPLARAMAATMRSTPCLVVGDTHVGTLAALCERAILVLGNDSGPLHLAAAVDTPTVALFGPADPIEFAPWGSADEHIVLTSPIGCRPCRVLDWGNDPAEFHPCVREITVGRVLEAARRAVRPTPSHSSTNQE